jgi:hypothetical protein
MCPVSRADACDEPQGDHNDPLILVEKDFDRLRVANSVGMKIINHPPIERYIHSIQQINPYGFYRHWGVFACFVGIL